MVDVTVLTQVGEDWIVDTIDAAADEPHHVHWGTGATGADKAQTTLSSASADETRILGTVTQPSTDVYQVVAKITALTNPKTITNAGCFTDATTGTLVLMCSHTGLALSVNDSIEYTFQMTVA